MDETERFWSKADKSNGPVHPVLGRCWIWTRAIMRKGYGHVYFAGKIQRAHRVSWELTNGKIANGMSVLHGCDNPACVNPAHLSLGTQWRNMHDCIDRGRKAVFRGGEHPKARLSESDVIDIRTLHAFGAQKSTLAEAFGLFPQTVHSIVRRVTWRSAP